MTHEGWLTCRDSFEMFGFLRGKVSDRKWRLYACGWCRLAWGRLVDPRSRHAVEVAERFADGEATGADLARAFQPAAAASASLVHSAWEGEGWSLAAWADSAANADATAWVNAAEASHPADEEVAAQAELLREVVGNPIRPVPIAPSWLSSAVVSLAEGVYYDRSFDRLPILADAVEEAGCTDPDILSHCRGGGPHTRGCWVVDLLLGRE